MPANSQEQLIHDLSQSILGRRSVFEPEEYRKGQSAIREPADVAWFCRDAVVLMYLKAGRKGWQRETERNLRQAEGWLTAWRRGRPLEGTVHEGPVSVPYDAGLAVMVLCVSADPGLTEIVPHEDDAARLGIDACATVSETFVRALADDWLGVVDLAMLLHSWPTARMHQPSLTDVELLNGYCGMAQAEAAKRAGWDPSGKPSKDLTHVGSILARLRSAVERRGRGADEAFHPNEFFCDLGYSCSLPPSPSGRRRSDAKMRSISWSVSS